MKYRICIVFLITSIQHISCTDATESIYKCADCKPPRAQKQSNSQEMARVVVTNFLAMLAQLLMTAQNPKDQAMFTAAIMGIAQGLGNIAIEASKSPKKYDDSGSGPYDTISKELYLRNDLLPEEIHALYVRYAEHFDRLND